MRESTFVSCVPHLCRMMLPRPPHTLQAARTTPPNSGCTLKPLEKMSVIDTMSFHQLPPSIACSAHFRGCPSFCTFSRASGKVESEKHKEGGKTHRFHDTNDTCRGPSELDISSTNSHPFCCTYLIYDILLAALCSLHRGTVSASASNLTFHFKSHRPP